MIKFEHFIVKNIIKFIYPNQCPAMQSRVHSVWQIQHHSKPQPARVQTFFLENPVN